MRISDWSSDVCSSDLYSHSGISMYGGFDGTETNLNQRDYEDNETVLDGLGERRILWIGADDITVDGLTLRNGFVDEENGGGGAVYISASHTAIQHCTLRDNIGAGGRGSGAIRSEEYTSELQSLMRISYAVFCLTKKTKTNTLCSRQYVINY